MIKVSKDTIELDIRGNWPRTFGDKNTEWPWREFVVNQVNRMKSEGVIPQRFLVANSSDCFEISIVFHIQSNRSRSNPSSDLDNLSKPVLDSLFYSPTGICPFKGALFQIDDHHVWKLHLEKRLAESKKDAGVSITIAIL